MLEPGELEVLGLWSAGQIRPDGWDRLLEASVVLANWGNVAGFFLDRACKELGSDLNDGL